MAILIPPKLMFVNLQCSVVLTGLDDQCEYRAVGIDLYSINSLLIVIGSTSADTIIPAPKRALRTFPDGFKFGVATASYQVEGAWNEDGKSENIWDHVTHKQPSVIADNTTGDIAVDSYHQYKRDVQMVRELGLDFYRFSLSWTRILPTSFPDKISDAGVAYYNNLIDELIKYKIEPVVTLYHWDLPQKLQDMGGWTNPYIIDWFGDYTRIAFQLFGDRVKYWITVNEPIQICYLAYGTDLFAPMLNISGVAEYLCAKNLLLAHANAYHIYDKEFKSKQNGKIFITIGIEWSAPENENYFNATEDAIQFTLGQYAHPIFSKTGDFPETMKKRIAQKSSAQGFARSRLPEFTPEEIDFIRGSSDFFGLNHYSTYLIYRNDSVKGFYPVPSLYDDMEIREYQPHQWQIGDSGETKPVPWGFYQLLSRIRKEYDNPPVFVTENGFTNHGGMVDNDRITYLRSYLTALLHAIDDGCDIRAYTIWTLMDNFEWHLGYIERYGLYEVDFESWNRTCTPRKSAFVYKQLVKTRALDLDYEPDTNVMSIDEGH